MAKDRQLLHEILTDVLGNRNVYFQPPETVKMKYPAIVYSLSAIQPAFADNTVYRQDKAYDVTVIDKNPDNPIVDKVSALPFCRFGRHFLSDNLHHYAFTIYF